MKIIHILLFCILFLLSCKEKCPHERGLSLIEYESPLYFKIIDSNGNNYFLNSVARDSFRIYDQLNSIPYTYYSKDSTISFHRDINSVSHQGVFDIELRDTTYLQYQHNDVDTIVLSIIQRQIKDVCGINNNYESVKIYRNNEVIYNADPGTVHITPQPNPNSPVLIVQKS